MGSAIEASSTSAECLSSTINDPVNPAMRITFCKTQGGRRYMEDTLQVHVHRTPEGEVDWVFFGVFDGHGGLEASHYARRNLLKILYSQPGFESTDDNEVLRAIRDAFMATHQAMHRVVDRWPQTSSGYTSTSGTTASICLYRRGKLYVGHVGDSAAMLIVDESKVTKQSSSEQRRGSPDSEGYGSDEISPPPPKRSNIDASDNILPQTSVPQVRAQRLTVDHKPDSPKEINRIFEAGGQVANKAGVVRVVWARPRRPALSGSVLTRNTPIDHIPFLAVARSLGDLWSYNPSLDTYIVSPEPDTHVVELGPQHVGLVLGTDGLWNVVTPASCAQIVNVHEWKELAANPAEETTRARVGQVNHARQIVRHALLRWGQLRADNISVIAVIFDHLLKANNPDTQPTVNGAENSCNNIAMCTVEQPVASDPSIDCPSDDEDSEACVPQSCVYYDLGKKEDVDIESLGLYVPDSVLAQDADMSTCAMLRVKKGVEGSDILRTQVVELVYDGAMDAGMVATNATKHVTIADASLLCTFSRESKTLTEIATATGDGDTRTTTEMDEETKQAKDEQQQVVKPVARRLSKMRYMCTKHGMRCRKVKRLNTTQSCSNLLDRSSDKRKRRSLNSLTIANGALPKYWCKDHGLRCHRALTLNGVCSSGHTTCTSSTRLVTVVSDMPTTPDAGSRKRRAPQLLSPISIQTASASSFHKYDTRRTARVTRSGRRLSPNKLRSGLRSPMRSFRAKRRDSTLTAKKRLSTALLTPRRRRRLSERSALTLPSLIVRPRYSRLSSAAQRSALPSGDVAQSVHAFRVARLKYCMKKHDSQCRLCVEDEELDDSAYLNPISTAPCCETSGDDVSGRSVIDVLSIDASMSSCVSTNVAAFPPARPSDVRALLSQTETDEYVYYALHSLEIQPARLLHVLHTQCLLVGSTDCFASAQLI